MRVNSDERHQIGRLDEIDLVDANDGANAALLGGDEQAVDQVRLHSRLGRARDDDKLIDVGDQHVLPTAASAANDAVAWFDPFDDPFALAFGTKPNDVASRNDMPFIGGQRFQQSARGALEWSHRLHRAP